MTGPLAGTLHAVEHGRRGAVVLAHCFTCSRSLRVIRQLATHLADAGYAVLRFDFTGLGESEGDFAHTTVTTNVEDLAAAVAAMRDRGLGTPALVGHSLGGTACLLAAADLPEVPAVAVIASPFHPDHVRRLFTADDVAEALATGQVSVRVAGRPFEISADFFHDLERHGTPAHLAALERPLMVVHGTRDRVVDITEGERIFAAASHPKWFAAVPQADHMLTRPADAQHAAHAIATFLTTTAPPEPSSTT
jgi:putative redox protein